MACRLCGGATLPLSVQRKPLRRYASCEACGFVQVETPDLPGAEEEKTRYLLHDNSKDNAGYVAWLRSFVGDAVLPFARPGSRILDFGCGPEPQLSALLEAAGFRVTGFDPFFAPSREWETMGFDAIILHEVFEHLAQPGVTMRSLLARCAPGGLICIRTRFLPADDRLFDAWWYRSDLTHVGFVSRETIGYLSRLFNINPIYTNGEDIVVFRA